jgi:anti-anti-sigma factor
LWPIDDVIRRPSEGVMENSVTSDVRQVVRVQERGGALVAELIGVIDVSVAEELHHQAMDLVESGKNVVIELGQTERLDASALQVLLAMRQDLVRRGRSFSMAGYGPEIRNYLERAGVSGDLTVPASEAA